MSSRIEFHVDQIPTGMIVETYADGTAWIRDGDGENRRRIDAFAVELTGERSTLDRVQLDVVEASLDHRRPLLQIQLPVDLNDFAALLLWCEERWPGCTVGSSDPGVSAIYPPAPQIVMHDLDPGHGH